MNGGDQGSAGSDPAGVSWWTQNRPRSTPWWVARRAELSNVELPPDPDAAATADADAPLPIVGRVRLPPGASMALMAAGVSLVVLMLSAHFTDLPQLSRVLVPVVGLFGGIWIAQWLQARHPDEPFLAKFLVLGVIVKIVASALRYRTLVDAYGAVGDATVYDTWGRRFANVWLHVPGAEVGHLENLRKSNFLRWFTGVVYYLFGRDIITGFFVFGLIALVGSYMWYRAAVLAVPFLNRKLFLILLLFAPSLAFWPASVGKEALMQFGLGGIALGTAHVMNGRLLHGVLVAFPSAWLVWTVRAHLFGLAVFAAAIAYVMGRAPRAENPRASLIKPLGLIMVSFLALFAVTQGAKALGLAGFSLSSVQTELEATQTSTAQGGSSFNHDISLSPLRLPQDAMTVLLRPFPWEVQSKNQILASLEGMALIAFMVYRRQSLAISLRKLRERPFIFYCWSLTLIYVMLFQAFGNFGLLVRQRSIVLPALYLLLCLEPDTIRNTREKVAASVTGTLTR